MPPRLGIPLVVAFAVVGPLRDVGAADDFAAEPGFESLFNGKDLSGWRVGNERLEGKTESTDGRFKARDGAIVIQGANPIKDIYTVREFGKDFVLRLEFRASPRANSGLHVRGKQLQVRDYPAIGPYKNLKHFKDGGWNAIEVTVKGNKAHCTCNGEVLEDALAVPDKGAIGLQSETNQIEYRRLRIREAH
jgi:hypothetical protein